MNFIITESCAVFRSLAWLLLALTIITPATVSAQDKQAEAAYEKAAALFNQGLWKQATVAYKEYFKKHPKHHLVGHAHYGLGLSYFNLKDYAAASQELAQAAKSNVPSKVEVYLSLGLALLRKVPASLKDAERAFDRSFNALGIKKTGIIAPSWTRQSVSEWLDKKPEAKKKQRAVDVSIGLLETSYMQGDSKSVIAKSWAFTDLVKGSIVEQRALVLAGDAHQKLKDFKKSAAAYEAASVLKGADASEALFRLGLVRINDLKDFEAAAKNFYDFQEKYKLDSKRPEATFNEALCYFHSYYTGKKEHLKKAIKLFEEFVKANGRHELADVAQYYVGKLKHVDDDWNGAIKALEPLLGSKNPALDQLVFLLGDSYHRLEQWEKGAKFYMLFARGNEKALNADVALHNAGLSYERLKKPDTEKAIFAYKLLEGKCPESPHLSSARLNLGIIHYEAEEYDEARVTLSKIPFNHALKPDSDYFMAWCDLDDKKPLDAAKHFQALIERLRRIEPDNRLVPLSKLYQGIGEFEGKRFIESTQTLSEFLAEYPDHNKLDEATFHLGLAYMKIKKWDKAIKSFVKVPEKSWIHGLALLQRGEVKIQMRDYKGAIQCIMDYKDRYGRFVTKNELREADKRLDFVRGIVSGDIPHPDEAIIPDRPPARAGGVIKGYGTGFFITTDGFILTNHHVVDDADAVVSIKIEGREIPAKIIKVDKENDLAVLKVKGEFNALPLKSSDNVKLAEEVFTLGYPRPGIQGTSIKYTNGRISSLAGWRDEPNNFQISVPIQPGNSGGPLVDENGNVVGVVVSQLDAARLFKERGSLPQNVNYAVKGSLALKLLKSLPKVREKNMQQPSVKGGKPTDVVDRTKKSVCMIIVR